MLESTIGSKSDMALSSYLLGLVYTLPGSESRKKGSPRARWTLQTRRHRTLECRFGSCCALVVLLAALSTPLAAFCPQECVCGTHNLIVSCEDAGLDVVPFQLNPQVTTIILTGNRISNLNYSFNFYTHLQYLDVSINNIRSLGRYNFYSLERLENLNLSFNVIPMLDKNNFKGLNALRLLDLSENAIYSMERGVFTDLQGLRELYLTGNRISHIAGGVLDPLVNLRILDLGGNELVNVPSMAVVNLRSLRVLSLNYNLIDKVQDNAFYGLRELTNIILENNMVSNISADAFKGLASLERMDLAYNNITTVPEVPFSQLARLTLLDLSGNMFTSIGSFAFHPLANLRELRLNNLVRLTSLDADALAHNKHLESVSMNFNPILTSLPTRLFQGNPLLSHVSLRGSAVRSLQAAHFPLDQLQALDLTDVPFTCNCSLQWLWQLCYEQRQQSIKLRENTTSTVGTATDGAGTTTTYNFIPEMTEPALLKRQLIVNINGIRCGEPPNLSGISLVHISQADMQCTVGLSTVAIVNIVVMAIFGLTFTVIFFVVKIYVLSAYYAED